MGCSAKAIAEDEDDLTDAMRKTGLEHHRDWRSIRLYSTEADAVEEAARKGLYMEDAIVLIKQRVQERDERIRAAEEQKERGELQRLINKYGIPT